VSLRFYGLALLTFTSAMASDPRTHFTVYGSLDGDIGTA
jgi:hypothetical protein